MKNTFVIYERKETLLGSITSDVFTLAVMTFCIWFSWRMNEGVWTFLTVGLLLFYLSSRFELGMAQATRGVIKLTSKREALDWANSLSEDE